MKKLIYILLASLMILPGCADYLDQSPEELNSLDKVFASANQVRKWHAHMFSTNNDNGFMVQEMMYCGQIPMIWCTDEAAYTQEPYVRNWSEGRMSPDNYYGYTGYNLYFFERFYRGIRHCNIFMENLEQCSEMGELEKRQYYAEARFMRAYYHWMLVRLYGPVPISDKSRGGDEIAKPQARNTFAECIEWIDNEINWCCENGMRAELNESLHLGLPTIGAARAIQARMHLLAASPLYNGNTTYASWKNNDGTQLIPQTYNKELWKKAADAAKVVIDMPQFDLLRPEDGNIVSPKTAEDFEKVVENIRKITTTWGAENNPENIWAVPNSVQWWGKCALPGRWGVWKGRYSLPLGFVNQFFMADGTLTEKSVDDWFANKQFSDKAGLGTIPGTFEMFVGREPRFYADIHFPNQRVNYYFDGQDNSAADLDDEGYGIVDFWYAGLSGHSHTPGDRNTSGLSPRKNLPLDYKSTGSTDTWQLTVPFPIIRLGEIYLSYAEALNEYYGQSKATEILQYLNAIRERAGIPGYKSYTTQEDMREKIRHERMIELCYEGQRWFDARRWFIAHGPEGVFNHNEYGFDMSKGEHATDPAFFTKTQVAIKRFDVKHYFMPVKASEVSLNTELVQAPFY